jgi:putative transcriptional regulator
MDTIKFQYMCRDAVMADVTVDRRNRTVTCYNYTENILLRPFGRREKPTLEDYADFMESRCFPRERRNCQQLLADLGLSEYVPLSIVEKTHGRQLEDYCWVKFEGEDLEYERDIKLRD